MARRKSHTMIAGFKPKTPAWSEDRNSDITGALDKLLLEVIAGAVPYHHCPPALATLTRHSRGGKHTKAPHIVISQGLFFARSNKVSPSTATLLEHRGWEKLSRPAYTTPAGSRPGTKGRRLALPSCPASSACPQRQPPAAPGLGSGHRALA